MKSTTKHRLDYNRIHPHPSRTDSRGRLHTSIVGCSTKRRSGPCDSRSRFCSRLGSLSAPCDSCKLPDRQIGLPMLSLRSPLQQVDLRSDERPCFYECPDGVFGRLKFDFVPRPAQHRIKSIGHRLSQFLKRCTANHRRGTARIASGCIGQFAAIMLPIMLRVIAFGFDLTCSFRFDENCTGDKFLSDHVSPSLSSSACAASVAWILDGSSEPRLRLLQVQGEPS